MAPIDPTERRRVAIVTGGSRGIGRGIVEALAESGDFQAIILTYNSNEEAAKDFTSQLEKDFPELQIEAVGGDLTFEESRNRIFECYDRRFSETSDLCLMVHNAGQYVGITSDNTEGLGAGKGGGKAFGDGSLIENNRLNLEHYHFYQKLYSEAYIDLCERSLIRMKEAHARAQDSSTTYRGCLIGISSPGCNHNYKMAPGYDMPGSGKCVMEFSNRYYALQAAPYGINANVVVPGATKSDAWGKLAERRGLKDADELIDKIKPEIPMKEAIATRELGDVVAFLASPTGGGRFMTGLSLRVDGGMHLK